MHQRLRSPLLATLAVSALVFAGILGVRAASLYFQARGVPISADPTDPTHIRFGQTTIRPLRSGSFSPADSIPR